MYAAAAISMIAKGFDIEEAARFGNYAAARAVGQYGARLKSRKDYQELFERFQLEIWKNANSLQGKYLSALAKRWSPSSIWSSLVVHENLTNLWES